MRHHSHSRDHNPHQYSSHQYHHPYHDRTRSRERDPGRANRDDRHTGVHHRWNDGRVYGSSAPPPLRSYWTPEGGMRYSYHIPTIVSHQENQSSARHQNNHSYSYSYSFLPHHPRHSSRSQPSHNDARSPHKRQQQEKCGDTIMVNMIKLPFFKIIETPLQTKIKSTDYNKLATSTFHIDKSLLQHFGDKNTTNSYQVQIRFCKNDNSSEQKDYFPPELLVKINGQQCVLPGWNTIPKGPATPVEITSKCDFKRNHNTLEVRTPCETIVAFIHVTKRLSHEDLIKKLLAKTPIDPSATVTKIKEKLQEDRCNGVDITMTSLHFSLLCPISKARMKIPCRASSCQHLQCFDAACYLKMNEKKPSWICPVCSSIIEYENLQIDEHFKNILEQNISNDKILLQADGSWKPFQPIDTNKSILTLDDTLDHPTPNGKKPHPADDKQYLNGDTEEPQHITIDLLSEDDSCLSTSEDGLPDTSCASSKGPQNDKGDEVVILSDDESPGSLADGTWPPLPSPSSWRPAETEASSTPKLQSTEVFGSPVNMALMPSSSTSSWKITKGNASNTPKSSKRKSRSWSWERIGKKTPKTANTIVATTTSSPNTSATSSLNTSVTSSPNITTDRPGTRMVLRSHVQRGKACKPT